ncbi:hypothetical protein F3Y22_tig00111834pilonHSYRG00035 [Hibiscus syriacus]|uniref:RNase H type-1 domain-containing protein n=1 Tax=Hibiscus syriacus TaxID=106335 RepID=A0A6A2Y7R7_HIBSY|nr:hypothetical protein F3Y22_tig00111834pilonHSYRG00035 [Hibiscus syriacus]
MALERGNRTAIKQVGTTMGGSRRSPPPDLWAKVNTDGSRKVSTGLTSCGGVIRDHDGIWGIRNSLVFGSRTVGSVRGTPLRLE